MTSFRRTSTRAEKSFSASRSTVCLIAKIGFVKYSEFPAVAGHRPEDRKAEEIC
jgi:hypothetical protein